MDRSASIAKMAVLDSSETPPSSSIRDAVSSMVPGKDANTISGHVVRYHGKSGNAYFLHDLLADSLLVWIY